MAGRLGGGFRLGVLAARRPGDVYGGARRTRVARAGLCLAALGVAFWPAVHGPVLDAQVRSVDLSRLEGRKVVVSNGANGREVAADVPAVTIRPDQYVVARWAGEEAATTPMRASSSQAWTTGFGFISVMPNGREVRFRPIIETAGGLQVVRDENGFRGQVFVGVVDLQNPSAAYDLPRPIALLVTGEADSVSPQQVQITHTNLPFTEVTVSARDPRDALELRLRASGTDERAVVRLPVVRPRLELRAAAGDIQGFGLETVEVSVRAVGLIEPEGRVVTLSTSRGSLGPSRVVLDAQGVGVATLRSAAVGGARLSASSPPLTEASTALGFSWPLAMLAAAMAGGLAGAAIRRVRGTSRGATLPLLPALATGLLAGIVAVVVCAAVASALPSVPVAASGEALAFALAVVAGFVGTRAWPGAGRVAQAGVASASPSSVGRSSTTRPVADGPAPERSRTTSDGEASAATTSGTRAPSTPGAVTGARKVFISYRRDDAADVAGRIGDHLVQRFGRDRVFMDVDSIGFGADFRHQISHALGESGVLLAIIGDEWLSPRLSDPDDYVAVEIGAALSRGTPVVPVLVGGARMPAAADLPPVLADLAYRNAAEVRSGRDFAYHVGRLADSVAVLVDDQGTNL